MHMHNHLADVNKACQEAAVKEKTKDGKVWGCKIGFVPKCIEINDNDMRDAVSDAFEKMTGFRREFLFSGWGAHLEEKELAVVEDRDPDPKLTQVFYVLKRPDGSFDHSTLAKDQYTVWSKAATLLSICAQENVEKIVVAEQLGDGGYSVVPVELHELRD